MTFLTLIGALVVTHAMLRRLTSWRCIIIIIIIQSEFNTEKKYKNWSTIAEVVIKIKVDYLFLRHGVY